MGIDALLPQIVRQKIALQKLDDENTPRFRDSLKYDPAGQENRTGEIRSSPAGIVPQASGNVLQSKARLQPQIPTEISEFLSNIAKKHGLEPPSEAQLLSAYKNAESYSPPPVYQAPETDGVKRQNLQANSQQGSQDVGAGFNLVNYPRDENEDKFQRLPDKIRQEAFDYGRMLQALSKYSDNIIY